MRSANAKARVLRLPKAVINECTILRTRKFNEPKSPQKNFHPLKLNFQIPDSILLPVNVLFTFATFTTSACVVLPDNNGERKRLKTFGLSKNKHHSRAEGLETRSLKNVIKAAIMFFLDCVKHSAFCASIILPFSCVATIEIICVDAVYIF